MLFHWRQWKWQTHFAVLQEISLLSLASFCQRRAVQYIASPLSLSAHHLAMNLSQVIHEQYQDSTLLFHDFINFGTFDEPNNHQTRLLKLFSLTLINNILAVWPFRKQTYMKSLNTKSDISIFINLRCLQLKLLKNKENNKEICDIFHNFENIPCYVTSEVSLKRFCFALFDEGLTLMAYIGFRFQTLHMYIVQWLYLRL